MRRQAKVKGVGFLTLVLLGLSACEEGGSTTESYPPTPSAGTGGVGGKGGAGGAGGAGQGGQAGGQAGTAGAGGIGAPGALGDACSISKACRPGLVCGASGVCELGHATAAGSPCTANGECVAGHICGVATHTCEKSTGTSKENETCQGDGECIDGLRCVLDGFAALCQPEGKGDVGKPCAGPSECLGGLSCLGGVCVQAPVGTPPLVGAPGKSEQCGNEGGDPIAWFHVPRGSNDGDFYRLPYPNNIRLKNGKPDLSGHVTTGPGLVGFDAVQRYIDEIQKRDGFGASAAVYLRYNTAVDIESLRKEGVVQFVDITKGSPELGQGLGYSWLLAYGRGNYICENWMGIRPAPYSLPKPGHTYAVLISKGPVTDKDKKPLQPSGDFTAMLADAKPSDAALAEAHDAYEPLRSYLKEKSISPDSLLVGTIYTVGATHDPAEKIAAAASAKAPATEGWVKCGAGPSPCPDATGDRACGPEDPDFDELHALVTLPIYQQGKAPYYAVEDGGGIDTSQATVGPVRVENVCLSLTVPKGKMPDAGWPVVVYAHGTGGSFRSHVGEGVAKSLATASAPMAVLGIDQVQHGPRRGGSTKGPDVLFYNFANPAAALGNPLQGAADQASLGALAASFSLDNSPLGGALKFDPEAVLFWGHSQGATEGALALPYSPHFRAVVFSGQGGGLADSLLSKTKPQNIAAVLPFALQDPEGFPPKLHGGNINPALALLQAYIDPADPVNHAYRMLLSPKEGATPKHVFQVYGIDDSFSPRDTQQNYAVGAGLNQVTPDASVATPDNIYNQTTNPPPYSGNFTSGDKSLTGALRQYKPDGYDGHFVAFKNGVANADVIRFLAQAAQKKVPEVGAK